MPIAVVRRKDWGRKQALAAILLASCFAIPGYAQQGNSKPSLRAGTLPADWRLDGVLDEAAWAGTDAIQNLTMIEPRQGEVPTGRTRVRVLAGKKALVLGVECDDPEPGSIVSFTKERDASLESEDHLKIVLDTFQDGRSGYVFSINPLGARYDALINTGGEHDNANWDGIWDAVAQRNDRGWSVEIWIPVQTLSFAKGLTSWHFNLERRIQRLQETSRWASPQRDFKLTQTSRAGLLTELPEFDLGIGLSVRPAVVAGIGVPSRGADIDSTADASLDITQRLGSNLLSSLSINTDFAETEVDARRSNLTRFPLFFPEKRTFFLEGADIFEFGLSLGEDVIPYFSRRVGLVSGQQVPIRVAGKISGRAGSSNMGAFISRTGEVPGLTPGATLGVARFKQNVFKESSLGMIATVGDPLGRPGSWLAGPDFTYQTSRFRGDKNFLIGVWALAMGRDGQAGDKTAAGFKVDYPNDLWDVTFGMKRIGDGFTPSLGFVPRPGIYKYNFSMEYMPRPRSSWLRQMFYEFRPVLVTDLKNRWESYQVFTAPLNWNLESGERLEFNIVPAGETLPEAFEISDGVTIPAGPYHWTRYRLEAGSAEKRKLSTQATWWFGNFYSGSLDQVGLEIAWHPIPLLSVNFNAEWNRGRLPQGNFNEDIYGSRFRFNFSPHLQLSSFIQYDTVSRLLGTNTRLRWTFNALGDLFIIYNHNVRNYDDRRWQLESNQLMVKLQYAFRY